MKKLSLLYTIVALILFTGFFQTAQAQRKSWIVALGDTAEKMETNGKFVELTAMFNKFLNSDTVQALDRYYIYRLKAAMYKWQNDYVSVERNLKLALQASVKTDQWRKCRVVINYEMANMNFDILNYDKADSLMKLLTPENLKMLGGYGQSVTYMQKGYLAFLKKDYKEAESLYKLSLAIMDTAEHCNTPIVYWKTQALYLAQGRLNEAEIDIQKGLAISKECRIDKYTMFMLAEAAIHYAKNGHCNEAFHYSLLRDSAKEAMYKAEHLDKMISLEKEFQRERDVEKIQLQKKTIEAKTNQNYLLAALVVCSVFLLVLLFTLIQFFKAKRYRRLKDRFTAKLLQNTEDERKRIATELHDSIGHNLLELKTAFKGNVEEATFKIQTIIEEVRNISRNLHPVMFDTVGLKNSLIQMIIRIQKSSPFEIHHDLMYNGGLDVSQELQLFRIVQEALSNIIKYAEPKSILIKMEDTNSEFVLSVKDNGNGFDVNQVLRNGQSFGLNSIIERSASIGGSSLIESSEKGTTVTIAIPKKR